MSTPLLACPQCNALLDESARFCPGCGIPRTALRLELETIARSTGQPYEEVLSAAKRQEGFELSRVVFTADRQMRMLTGTTEEIKLTIKTLRLMKKELGVRKRAITAEMTALRVDRRMQVAQQGSKVRGRGTVFRIARDAQTIGRDRDRLRHVSSLGPLEDQKLAIDERIRIIDRAIIQLEHHILTQDS